MEDFFLFLRYKNKTIKFKVTDPNTDLEVLMTNLRKAVDNTGTRIFDLPDPFNSKSSSPSFSTLF